MTQCHGLGTSLIELNEMFKDEMYEKIKERLEKFRGKNKAKLKEYTRIQG